MTGHEGRTRRPRRLGWKLAGVTLLGLMGPVGCRSPGDHLLPAGASVNEDRGSRIEDRGSNQRDARSAALEELPSPQPLEASESAAAGTLATEAAGANPSANAIIDPAVVRVATRFGKAEEPPRSDPGVGEKGAPSKQEYQPQRQPASPAAGFATPAIPSPEVQLLTLASALSLAGVANPTIGIAEQAVQASLAEQLRARVLLLPSLNVGTGYNLHNGNIQTSFGAIRKTDRQSVYFGLGARAVVAETVSIPGIWLLAHLGDAIYEPMVARRVVNQRRFEAVATRNNVLLDVAITYLNLLGSEGRLAVLRQSEADLSEVARITAAYAQSGQGAPADAERARSDLLLLQSAMQKVQEDVAVAAANLSELLNLDPSIRLQTADLPVVMVQFVDPQVPLEQLLRVAVTNRPEARAAAAAVSAAQARLNQEKTRPLFPMLSIGFSAGGFGGGAVASGGPGTVNGTTVPSFGNFSTRTDFDAIAFWTLQNAGLGNLALVKQRRAQFNETEAQRGQVINQIDREVADAYNLSRARFQQVEIARRQVETAVEGFQFDLRRIRGFQGRAAAGPPPPGQPPEVQRRRFPRPIELLNSAKLLAAARQEFVQAIVTYDEAQFQLFVALGQPPTLVVKDDSTNH